MIVYVDAQHREHPLDFYPLNLNNQNKPLH